MLHGLLWILVFSFFAHAGFSGLLAIWIAGHFLGQVFGFAVSVACVTMHVMGLHWMSLDWIFFHMRGSNLVSFCLQPLRGNVFAAQEQRHGDVSGWFWNCTATRRTARCCFGSSVSCTGLRRGMLFFLLAGTMRIGEALHPGPPPGSTWTLGIANPSGLNGKLDQVNHLPGDAWIFSETQLSQRGVSAFAKGLKMLQSPWRYMVAGAPCVSRARTDTGTHAGVMLVSRFPSRALPHNFASDVYASARVQVVGMAVADTWVTVGMLYGVPCNAHHKQARYQTDAMLSDLVDRIGCQTIGPRAIGGDFQLWAF